MEEESKNHRLTERKWATLSKGFLSTLLLVVIAYIAMYMKRDYWMHSPNDSYIGLTFDGLKNYMTFSYQLKHDSTYVKYTGMNYPFGEHELFTDNQPLLSNVAQWWSRNVFDISDYAVGIMNVYQVISILSGCLVLFWLLRRLSLPKIYAVAVALGIGFLSPQHLRFDGHFGLSHTWIIPLFFFLLMYYEERNSKRYASLWIGILVLCSSMLHMYYFGMFSLFLLPYMVFSVLGDFSFRSIYTRMSHSIVMLFIPYFAINVWLKWDAVASDRTETPFGIMDYIGQPSGVFLPYPEFALHDWIDAIIPITASKNPEDKSYIGIVAVLFCAILIISGFKFFRDKKWWIDTNSESHVSFARKTFFSAVLLLLLAFGLPFSINGLEGLLDYLGPFKQFRGFGRFTWPFFYITNVLAFYSLYHYSVGVESLNKKRILLLFPVLLLLSEAAFFQKTLEKGATINTLTPLGLDRTYGEDVWTDKVDFDNYQALLPLPYYHIGSENVWLDPSFDHFQKTQVTAFYSGLPDMGVMMSRTSIGQTMKSLQFVLKPCQIPSLLTYLPSRKPLLMVVETKHIDSVAQKYPALWSQARFVFENPLIAFYELPLDSIRSAVQAERRMAERAYNRLKIGLHTETYSTNKKNIDFYHTDYEDSNSSIRFQGKGSLLARSTDTTRLFKGVLDKGKYELSLWVFGEKDQGVTGALRYQHRDNSGSASEVFQLHKHIKTIVNGWAMQSITIDVKADNTEVDLFLHRENSKYDFYIDEVLLRPEDTELFMKKDQWLAWNGYWYE